MTKTSLKAQEAGFTLLEMLVVLALLSLLMAVLSGTIYLGISARARVTTVATDQQDFSSFRRILIEKLATAYPEWITNGQTGRIAFSGAPEHLSFLAPALDTQGPGFAQYNISLVQETGKPAILLQSAYDEGTGAQALTAYFAAGLATIKLQFFGAPRDGATALWQDNWTMRSSLPDLVSIKVTFPKGDRRSWPVLIIHPEIDGDITCEVDPNTHGCLGR